MQDHGMWANGIVVVYMPACGVVSDGRAVLMGTGTTRR